MEYDSDPVSESKRPPYRPPIGVPGRPEPRAQATVASLLLHTLVVILILAPTIFVSTQLRNIENRGAGGPGPQGGGGGGNAGNGGIRFVPERLRYLRLKAAAGTPAQPKPEEKKEEQKPKEEPPKPPPSPEPTAAATTDSASITAAADKSGSGGTGKDGSQGSGPGSGGGVGSGVGTGRGSANGPGTGGGTDDVYPPTVVSMPILPIPVPAKVRPYKMVAYFEVDSTGNARLLSFTPSRDANYNKRVREMLMEIRFRPAVRMNGVAVRDTAVVTAEAM